MSNAAFKANFAKLLGQAGEKAEMVVRRTALELQSSMIEMSPVLSGRFKGNWQSGYGSVNARIGDAPGSDAKGRMIESLPNWKPGQTIFLTNSLPYAKRLEYDSWSRQAPGGMVRLTVQNYSAALAKAVASIK